MTQLVSFQNHQAHHRDLKFGRGSPSSSLAIGRILWSNPAMVDRTSKTPIANPRLETRGSDTTCYKHDKQ
jgi:hypothetical protein